MIAVVRSLTRHIVLVLVVPTSLRMARIAHSTKSYVGQAVLVLDSVRTERWSDGVMRQIRIAPRMRGVEDAFGAGL
jgi:hypothetical protein